MSNKLEAAARQALDALEVGEFFVNRHSEDWYISGQKDLKQIRETITSLREALAEQAEQEPVAYVLWGDNNVPSLQWEKPNDGVFNQLYYAAPVRTKDPCHPWQDLTDDEIISALGADMDTDEDKECFIEIVRLGIAAYKEKNP